MNNKKKKSFFSFLKKKMVSREHQLVYCILFPMRHSCNQPIKTNIKKFIACQVRVLVSMSISCSIRCNLVYPV